MRVRVGTLLLCSLLLVPAASAAEGEGSFVVNGRVMAPSGGTVEGASLAFFAATADPTAFEVKVPRGNVYAFEQEYATLGGLALSTGSKGASWTVEDATIRLLSGGDHAGFLAVYPDGEGWFTLEATGPMSSEPRSVSTLGNGGTATADKAGTPDYTQTISRAHLLTRAAGTAGYEGRGGVKVNGMDVEIVQAQGNTTRHETGVRQASDTKQTFTWVYVELQAPATLTLEGQAPVTLAMQSVTVTHAADLAFTPIEGELRTSEGTYLATGKASSVEGSFRAFLTPLPDGRAARLDLNGDVRPSASFIRHPAPSVAGAESPAWWGMGLVLGTLVAAGGAAFTIHKLRPRVRPIWRRGVPSTPRTSAEVRLAKRLMEYDRLLARVRAGDVEANGFTAPLYLLASKVAEAEEDWAAMHDLMRAARMGAPEVGEYAMREGFALFYGGEPAKAAGAFHDAAHLMLEEGEPQYWLARCHVRMGQLGEAERALSRALGCSPELLDEVETCPDFAPLRGREDFENIKNAVHVRLDADQDGKDNF